MSTSFARRFASGHNGRSTGLIPQADEPIRALNEARGATDVAGTPANHPLDGRYVIVDVSLRAKSGGILFEPNYCDRTSIK